MTEVQESPVTTADAPKAKRESTKAVPFGTIHVAFAKRSGKDTTQAAKQNRNFIRTNFEVLCRVWPELRASQKANRDGNRYPATIPSHVATLIVKRDSAGLAAMAKRKKA